MRHAASIELLGQIKQLTPEQRKRLFVHLMGRELASSAKGKIEAWRRYYNEDRPHSAQGWMTPAEFAEQCRNGASKEVSQEPEISS